MPHLSTTFDQFTISLTEFVDRRQIVAHFSECLALYAAGCSLAQVAWFIEGRLPAAGSRP